MQIPSNLSDPFIKSMTNKGEIVRQLFLGHIETLTNKIPVKTMLGDGTVTSQESFDPSLVRQFYERVLRTLNSWESAGVSSTADKDLRRSFIKFEIRETNYVLSCHMSLQYHAILFYRPDHRVIEIQRELAGISDRIKQVQQKAAPEVDKIIEEKLRLEGYENVDQQKLFEVLFEREDLTEQLTKLLESRHHEENDLNARQEIILKELDNLLLEIYHTTPVMIDEMKMISAEEGCLCIFNLDHLKKGTKEGHLNLERIPGNVKDGLLNRMDEIIYSLKF